MATSRERRKVELGKNRGDLLDEEPRGSVPSLQAGGGSHGDQLQLLGSFPARRPSGRLSPSGSCKMLACQKDGEPIRSIIANDEGGELSCRT